MYGVDCMIRLAVNGCPLHFYCKSENFGLHLCAKPRDNYGWRPILGLVLQSVINTQTKGKGEALEQEVRVVSKCDRNNFL